MIEAIQTYVIAFAMLLIAAPTLVGIVSPLITPVIRELEKVRLKRLQELKKEAHKLARARNERELKEAKKKLEEATEEYKKVREMTRYLDFSIGAGIFVTLICGAALIFSISSPTTTQPTTNYQIFLGVAIIAFWVESFLLLLVVLFHIKSIRRQVIEKLSCHA